MADAYDRQIKRMSLDFRERPCSVSANSCVGKGNGLSRFALDVSAARTHAHGHEVATIAPTMFDHGGPHKCLDQCTSKVL